MVVSIEILNSDLKFDLIITKNKSLILSFRETLFDVIDKNIEYPPLLDSDLISAVSFANSKIIATSKWTDFRLFTHEKDDWTESFVEFREEILSLNILSEQLLTVRNLELER